MSGQQTSNLPNFRKAAVYADVAPNQVLGNLTVENLKVNGTYVGPTSGSSSIRSTRFLKNVPVASRQEVLNSGIGLNNTRYLPANGTQLYKPMSLENARHYQVFKTTGLEYEGQKLLANSQTFDAQCDKEYVYYCWEIGSRIDQISGTDWTGWAFGGFSPLNWLANSSAIFIKQDRVTGEIVLAKPMGQVTGLATSDITRYDTTGDDICRGPFAIHGDYIYVCGQGTRYASVIKMDKNFNLVWRYIVPGGNKRIEVPGHPELSTSGVQMRTIMVIPPTNGRANPLVLATATAGLPYGTLSYEVLIKLFGYYNGSGQVFCYEDNGSTATHKWSFNAGPDILTPGMTLPESAFTRVSAVPGAAANTSIRIYTPLKEGLQFVAPGTLLANANQAHAGTFLLLSGRQVPASSQVASGRQFDWEAFNVTFTAGTTFSSTATYSGIIINGPNAGQSYSVQGSLFLQDGSVQPIVKTLYYSQVGSYVLNDAECWELNYYGGGVYGNMTYDETTDTVVFGTANGYHVPYEVELTAFQQLLPGDQYPLVDGQQKYNALKQVTTNLPSPFTSASVQVMLNRWASFWEGHDNLLVNNNFGARERRLLFDTTVGVRCSDGKIQFACRHQGIDPEDHTISFGRLTSKTGWFHPNGWNQDNQIGSTIQTINGVKYLCALSKSRLFIYRFNDLFNTLVPYDLADTITYSKGIKENNFANALVWKDTCTPTHYVTAFNGMACDGKNLIRRAGCFGAPFGAEIFPPGIERHYGYLIDPVGAVSQSTTIICYDLPAIIANPPASNQSSYKWAFMSQNVGVADVGTVKIYGDIVIFGDKTGTLYLINKETGDLVNTLIDPTGFAAGGTIADGIIYSYGGSNKWGSLLPQPYGDDIYMWTPFGQ